MPSPLRVPPELWPLFLRLTFGTEVPDMADPAVRDRLIKSATAEGLLPLLFADPALPEALHSVRASMRGLEALMRARYRLHLEAAKRYAAIVGEGLFLKGFDYRHRLYPAPELRVSQDIDVILPSARVPAAVRALTDAGYPQVRSAHGTVWTPGNYYEVSFDIGEVRLELHRSLGHKVRAAIDYDELWSRREAFEVDGTTFARTTPAHAIVVHAISLAKDELSASLARWVDLSLMLERWSPLLAEVVEIAKRWRVERALYSSLRVAGDLFPSTRSEAMALAQQALLSQRERSFLDRRVIPDLSHIQSGHIDGRMMQLWRKFWLTDGVARRLAFIGYSIWILGASRVAEARHPHAVDDYIASKRRTS
jgi:hypothetical protein